jgi:hypothetical protein
VLYRILVEATKSRRAAVAGLVIYFSSTGLLASVCTFFLPAKPLTMVIYIFAFYSAMRLKNAQKPGELLFQIRSKHRVLLPLMILAGLFTDETPAFLLVLLPVMFPSLFIDRANIKARWRSIAGNLFFFGLPLPVYLVLAFGIHWIVSGTSPLFAGWLESKPGAQESILATFLNTMSFKSIFINLGNYFSLPIVPHFLSGLEPVAASRGSLLIQETNFTKIVTLALFAGLVAKTALSRASRAPLLISFAVGGVGYVVLLSLIHFQFIPWTNGTVYGSTFPVFHAAILALLFGELAGRPGPQHQVMASLLVLVVCLTQIYNYQPISEAWRLTQLRLTAERYAEKKDPVISEVRFPSEITLAELQGLRSAWSAGTLDDYLRRNGVSSAAAYFLWELRTAGPPR